MFYIQFTFDMKYHITSNMSIFAKVFIYFYNLFSSTTFGFGNPPVNSKYSIFIRLMRTDDSSFSSSYWQWKAINIIQVKTRQYFLVCTSFWIFLCLISSFFFNLETIKLNFFIVLLDVQIFCRRFCQHVFS